MDRKLCVLVYSNFSQASIDLVEHIKNLPLDLPTMIGLTMFNVDSDEAKSYCIKHQIHFVPTLLIEYYNGERQKLENQYIYSWITQILSTLRVESPVTSENIKNGGKTKITFDSSPSLVDDPVNEPTIETNDSNIHSNSPPRKRDITSMALEMQKSRESDLADLKERQKPI